MNILVTGVNGQLGTSIQKLSPDYTYKMFFTCKDNLDITKQQEILEFITHNDIQAIINCAAYTLVDKAEDEKDLAFEINSKGIENLAKISKEKDILLVHISTDYVFDGTNYKPYTETDTTNPQSIYGITKLQGENALISVNPKNSIIIRTAWVYSEYQSNFVKTILKLAKDKDTLNIIYDQVGTPTYADDLAKTILDILPKIQNDKVEIYHYTNEGVVSWYDFAKEIIKMAKLTCKIEPIETKDYPVPATRPHFSLLNKTKIKKKFNIKIPYWKDSLDKCLRNLEERR